MMSIRARQTGATLIISLVFLLVFLVMALSIFRGALTSSQAIGNMQWRNEAISAANEVIDALLSSADVVTDPKIIDKINGPDGKASGRDTDGNVATSEIFVTLPAAPACIRVRPIPASELSPSRIEDAGCFASSSSGGIAVASGGGATPATGPSSLCADSEWSVTARATDPSTSTNVEVVQGFAVRVPTVSIPETCE